MLTQEASGGVFSCRKQNVTKAKYCTVTSNLINPIVQRKLITYSKFAVPIYDPSQQNLVQQNDINFVSRTPSQLNLTRYGERKYCKSSTAAYVRNKLG